MTHFEELEPIALPDEFAQALLTGASCEAVVVESKASGIPIDASDADGKPTGADVTGVDTGRRGSVALFRVGRAYVAEIVERRGPARTVGLAPGDAKSYVDRVSRDDEWTVLSIEGALSATGRGAREQKRPPAGRQ